MDVVVWVAASVAGLLHILVFVWEALLFRRPAVHQGIFGTATADVDAVRLWAFGVGFYNLFIGLGLLAGVALWVAGSEAAGRTLVLYLCAVTALSAVVLVVADRMAMSRPRGAGLGGALGQGLPPAVALIATALASAA